MNALKMSALVCAAVLIGVLAPISGRTETRDLPEIEVLEAEPDHGVVRVGDFIIEGTPDHVEITTEGRGLVGAYDFDYTPGEPNEVKVYDSRSGKELITIEIRDPIVDETNSFWLVTGKEKISSKALPSGGAQYAAIVIPVVNLFATVPNYYRAGSLLLWDFADLGDPDDYVR